MDFAELAILSWREALIAIVVLLAIYLLVVFLRFLRLKREKLRFGVPDSPVSSSAIAAYRAAQNPEAGASAASSDSLQLATANVGEQEFDFPWNEPPPGVVGQPAVAALENEVAQLRKEVGGLRAEILVLREDLRREPATPPVTQNVSPLYSDAMQMAMQGNDAASISQYCGISRAEAELVVALVRNGDNAK